MRLRARPATAPCRSTAFFTRCLPRRFNCRKSPGGGGGSCVCAAVFYAESADYLEAVFEEEFAELVQRMNRAFRRAAPHLSEKELRWRVHFAVGAMVHTMMDSDRIRRWTQGLCDTTRVEETIDHMVRFASAGNERFGGERRPRGSAMRYRGILPAAAVLFLGCSQSVPRPARQFTVEAPRAWKGGAVDAAAADVDWWAYFGDSGLDLAIGEALTKNSDLRAAAARIAAARQETRIAAAAGLPELSLDVNRSRRRQNFVGLPFPGLAGRVLSATNTNTGLSLNLTWEADIWKRIEAGKLAAAANLESREADLAGARLSLTAQVAKAWFAAIEAERQVASPRRPSSVMKHPPNACGRVTARASVLRSTCAWR